MKNYLEFFMNSLYRVWGEPGRQDDAGKPQWNYRCLQWSQPVCAGHYDTTAG